MPISFAPIPVVRFYDDNNVPLRGGLVYTYLSGTSTAAATYTDSTGSTPNTNPIVLDSRGEARVFLDTNLGNLKFVVTDRNGNPVQTLDPVTPPETFFLQTGTGAIKRTVQSKLAESVSVKDFGALGDGATNDTAAIQLAFNSGNASVFFPSGTYLTGPLTSPGTLHRIYGIGKGAHLTATGAYNTYDAMIVSSSASGLEVDHLTMDMSPTTYTTQSVLNFNSPATFSVHDVDMVNSGGFGVSASSPVDIKVERCNILNWHSGGVLLGNALRASVIDNTIPGSGTQTSFNIQITGGSDHVVTGNVLGANESPNFEISLYGCTRSVVSGNTCSLGQAEAINFQNCSACVMGYNSILCSASSHDFGVSIYGDNVAGASTSQCIVIGNVITRAGKAGIGVAQKCSDNLITGNSIYQCNGMNQAQWGGVTVYGGLAFNNVVQGNFLYDDVGNMKFGVAEWDDGTGLPVGTKFIDNSVFSTASCPQFSAVGTTTLIWALDWTAYTPTLSAASGTITTSNVNSAAFLPRGRVVHWQADVATATNGTGAGTFNISLPTGFSASTFGGVVSGRQVGTGGLLCAAAVAGASVPIVTYNSTYPMSDGQRLQMSGEYRKA